MTTGKLATSTVLVPVAEIPVELKKAFELPAGLTVMLGGGVFVVPARDTGPITMSTSPWVIRFTLGPMVICPSVVSLFCRTNPPPTVMDAPELTVRAAPVLPVDPAVRLSEPPTTVVPPRAKEPALLANASAPVPVVPTDRLVADTFMGLGDCPMLPFTAARLTVGPETTPAVCVMVPVPSTLTFVTAPEPALETLPLAALMTPLWDTLPPTVTVREPSLVNCPVLAMESAAGGLPVRVEVMVSTPAEGVAVLLVNCSVPPITTWGVKLLLERLTPTTLLALKFWNVTVTLSGTLSPDSELTTMLLPIITLPPVAMPPLDTVSAPPRMPCFCSPTM